MKKFFYYLTLLSSLIAFVIGCSKEEEKLPKLELNATELSFKSEGGDELVGVTSNTNWSAVSSEKWCEVSPSSSNGNGAIKVTAQKNEKSESRAAKISVVSGSLTRIVMVSQAGSGSENGSGGNNEEGGNGSGNENGGGNGSNNDGDNTPNPTVTYTVTLTSSPIMGGYVTGGGSYDYNSSVTIKATPSTGYVFSEWSDGNTSASRTITVKEDKSLTARFVKEVYKITLNASPSEGGEVSGAGSYDYGTSVILKAIPNEGYTFVRWSDGVTTNPRTITVTGSVIYEAIFEKIEEPLESLEPLDKSLGRLPGRFSVSSTEQVSFSQGNLQYQASTDTWRFAENQYDVIGSNNKNISPAYSGWIDLFGWGTSGYNSKYPYMTSTYDSDYGDGNRDIAGANYDWGVYNAISNGGNKAGMWRTLTYDEWNYLFSGRTNAKNLRGRATVNGQTGYILLPDGWSKPSGLTFTANPGDFTTNSYSAPEWSRMEAAGAVFLPAAGYRLGTTLDSVGSNGYYWSSTCSSSNAYDFYFGSSFVDPDSFGGRHDGHSVRLVQE